MSKIINLYTDGACSGNPGPGGWGVLMLAREGGAVVKERTLHGGEALTTNNRMELGDPNNQPEYERLRAYCPYTNLEAKSYPAMLVRTSFNDSQVMYWEPAKYVARLRALSSSPDSNSEILTNPLLFKTNMSAGHGGASGRYDAIKDTAWDFAFVMKVLEMTPETGVAA